MSRTVPTSGTASTRYGDPPFAFEVLHGRRVITVGVSIGFFLRPGDDQERRPVAKQDPASCASRELVKFELRSVSVSLHHHSAGGNKLLHHPHRYTTTPPTHNRQSVEETVIVLCKRFHPHLSAMRLQVCDELLLHRHCGTPSSRIIPAKKLATPVHTCTPNHVPQTVHATHFAETQLQVLQREPHPPGAWFSLT